MEMALDEERWSWIWTQGWKWGWKRINGINVGMGMGWNSYGNDIRAWRCEYGCFAE